MRAPAFQVFGPDHVVALLLVALASLLAVMHARRRGAAGSRPLRLALAFALLGGMLAEPLVASWQGWFDWQLLPLHLCDVAAMLAVWSLLTLDLRAIEPLYFFALSGTLPALVTPELAEGFPAFRFLIYFIPHGLVVLSGLVLVVGLRRVPRAGAWWRVFLLLNLHALLAGLVNWRLGTNFLYLARKPMERTPFDWFGPWPYYIATLEPAFLAVFRLLDLPLRRGRAPAGTPRAA